jgi:hypothetical protein
VCCGRCAGGGGAKRVEAAASTRFILFILLRVSQRYAVSAADQKIFQFVDTVELLSLQIVLVSEIFSVRSLFMWKAGFAAIKY